MFELDIKDTNFG